MPLSLLVFLEGFSVGFSMIIAVGVQNTFVLKQGILRTNSFLIASICSFIYAMLILLGIYGVGQLLLKYQSLLLFFSWGGVLFLFGYGMIAFYSCFKTHSLAVGDKFEIDDIQKTIIKVIAVSLLSPMVYVETCVLIGSLSTQFSSEDLPYFTLGTIVSAFVWFFSLSFGARTLKPFFKNPIAWKALDFMIGCIMFAIAISFANSLRSGS
jgi:L-lysine exporter family protein LysE/ArgO